MSSINTNYTSYPGLASYLGSPGTTQNNATGSTTPSLVTLLGNDSSDNSNSNDLFSFFEQNSGLRNYSFPTDGNGKTFIPTVDQMNNASTPDSKLNLASYVAQAVLMQSDASSKTDNATRISDITGQAQSVLQALASATTNLTSTNGSLSTAEQNTTSATLNAINTTLSQVINLLPKTDATTQASLRTQLSNLDTLAFNIGGLTGTSWTSVTGNSNNTISGYSAAASNNSSSATSNSLLNITV